MLMGDAASSDSGFRHSDGLREELDAARRRRRSARKNKIYGPESSGKTTIALHIIAEAQKMGGMCVLSMPNMRLTPFMPEKLGISMDKLYVSQPDNGEQAL